VKLHIIGNFGCKTRSRYKTISPETQNEISGIHTAIYISQKISNIATFYSIIYFFLSSSPKGVFDKENVKQNENAGPC
jgi:hypothetical protein